MKSAKALLPILVIVLLVCTMALTFAWFSLGNDTSMSSSLEAGTYTMVQFSDAQGIVSEKYNGQKGYDENGNLCQDADAPYEGLYHTSMKLQGDGDLNLKMQITEVLVKVTPDFYGYSATSTFRYFVQEFDGYDGVAQNHVAQCTFDEHGNPIFGENAVDAQNEVFVYTSDGTLGGEVLYIRMDIANVQKFFTFEYAKITSDKPPYAYGDFVDTQRGLTFLHGPNSIVNPPEVASDIAYGKANAICAKITYSSQNYKKPFIFADEAFKGSTFLFNVLARAEAV